MRSSKTVSVDQLPEKATIAAYELTAQMLREEINAITILLPNVTDNGDPIGSFEILIRKTA